MLTLEGNQGRPKRIGRVSEANGRCFTALSRPEGGVLPCRRPPLAPGTREASSNPGPHLHAPYDALSSVLSTRRTLLLTVTPGRAEMTDPTPRQGNLLNWKSHKGIVLLCYLWNSLFCNERNCVGPVCRWDEYIGGCWGSGLSQFLVFPRRLQPPPLPKHSHHCSSKPTTQGERPTKRTRRKDHLLFCSRSPHKDRTSLLCNFLVLKVETVVFCYSVSFHHNSSTGNNVEVL